MQLIIWGAGEMGRRVLPYLCTEKIVAFIDSDIDKIGKQYFGIQIISLDEYVVKYHNIPILISPLAEEEIENILLSRGIKFYFRLSDCPSEFSNIEYTNVLEKFCMDQITEHGKYVIYGSTLFSLILNQWIKKKRSHYVKIILPKSVDNEIYNDMKRENPNMHFLRKIEDVIQDDVVFLVTDEWDIDYLNDQGIASHRIINLYDISDRENSYYNPEIESYKDIHKGEQCFIIGHGPSLRTSDLDILEANHMVTFSMNLINKLIDKSKWRPDYYVVSTREMFDDPYYFRWDKSIKRKCFIADISAKFWENNKSENNIKYHAIKNMNTREAKFSEDISRRVYYGATVTYVCMQIAAYMGFKKIYLLGMDLVPYKQGDKSAFEYSHFYDESDSQKSHGKLWVDKIICAYNSAKKYADAHDIQIYNATRGGYLEVFPRVDFETLFAE